MIGEAHPMIFVGADLPRSARLVKVGLAGVLAMAVALIWLQQAGPLMPTCFFHELTGVSCLTCGLTRSLEAATHGKILAAFRFHLLGPFILAGMLVACVVYTTEALTGRRVTRFLKRVRQRQTVLVIAALWIVYGVARAIVELLRAGGL
jgi:hypothetical protein